MGTATLFGDSDDLAPARTPPPESVVRELVGLGVAESTARGWGDRQAFAVLAKKRQEAAASPARARAPAAPPAPVPPPPPQPPPPQPPKVDRGASTPERWQSANELEQMLAGGEDRGIPWERRCQRLAAGLYVLSPVEWDEVVAGVISRLRADQTPEGPTVKCISLWQPWASLVVHGIKRCETRGWPTDHRGPLLIHAAKTWTGDVAGLCHRDPALRAALERMGHPIHSYAPGAKSVPVPQGMPFGAIVGRVNLTACYAVEDVWEDSDPLSDGTPVEFDDGKRVGLRVTPAESALGDYSPGRFAWLLADPVRFERPIPYRGHQSIFDVPEEVVRAALESAGVA